MKRTHTAHIETDDNGTPKTYNRHMVAEFFRMHPNSFFEAKFKKKTKGHSTNTMRYFWAEVVPKMQMGLKSVGYDFDLKTTEDYIKQFSPIMYDEIEFNGAVTKVFRSIKDLDQDEFGEYIETLKRLAAEEFSLIINDPT